MSKDLISIEIDNFLKAIDDSVKYRDKPLSPEYNKILTDNLDIFIEIIERIIKCEK